MFYNVNVQGNTILEELTVDHLKRSLWLTQANSYKHIDHRSYANVVKDGRAVVQTLTTSVTRTNTCNKSKGFVSDKHKSTTKQDTNCSNKVSKCIDKQICPSTFHGQPSPIPLTNLFKVLQIQHKCKALNMRSQIHVRLVLP